MDGKYTGLSGGSDLEAASHLSAAQTLDLARKEAALRTACRIALVGSWEVDFVAGVTTFSPELCGLLGAPPLPPMSIDEANNFWCEDDRAAFRRALERIERLSENMSFDGRSIGPDGVMSWWHVLGEPVLSGGRCVALRGVAQNVTETRALLERERAALRAADEMSGFLATMSHEIRTPLNGVLGMAQVMARNELSDPQRERLAVIKSSGEALLALINNILDLSKIEAGKVELEDGVVDIDAIAEETRTIFSALAGDKDVGFRLLVAPAAKGLWAGDPGRVRQVLNNLISNAGKFTSRGWVGLDVSLAGERLILRVEDTGVGIPSSSLAQIFDKFVQADTSTTRQYGGTGLGLTICRELVTLMGGEIEVESVAGKGTVFTVSLPARRIERPVAETPQSASEPSEVAGLRILAAEDNLTNQRVLKALLGAAGLQPHIVANGQEAVDAWEDGVWDIILMDVQMPVMDGPTATAQIRQMEAREGRVRTPIIALTANAMAHHQAIYRQAGMDALVPKPIDLGLLLSTMDSLLAPAEEQTKAA